jgi:hypothetical protein
MRLPTRRLAARDATLRMAHCPILPDKPPWEVRQPDVIPTDVDLLFELKKAETGTAFRVVIEMMDKCLVKEESVGSADMVHV